MPLPCGNFAFVYLMIFLPMYLAGPVKYFLERLFAESLRTKP